MCTCVASYIVGSITKIIKDMDAFDYSLQLHLFVTLLLIYIESFWNEIFFTRPHHALTIRFFFVVNQQ